MAAISLAFMPKPVSAGSAVRIAAQTRPAGSETLRQTTSSCSSAKPAAGFLLGDEVVQGSPAIPCLSFATAQARGKTHPKQPDRTSKIGFSTDQRFAGLMTVLTNIVQPAERQVPDRLQDIGRIFDDLCRACRLPSRASHSVSGRRASHRAASLNAEGLSIQILDRV